MIGTTLAHYRITAELGQGGMGEVYRATDTKLDREVAIKILPKSFAEDRNRVARFNREAKALAALNHPNIAMIYGIEKSQDTHALVMELIGGETLGQRLKREAMPITEALGCCKQIAEALEAAHERGIIHRDLKPENVKIDGEGRVKLLDFGLAKTIVGPQGPDASTLTGNVTLPGVLMGTPSYMSPEQAKGETVDERSDIWSFGCILFECLTGQRAFKGNSVSETIGAVMQREPDWSKVPMDTPPTIRLCLRRCLAKDRRRRLPSIAGVRFELQETLLHADGNEWLGVDPPAMSPPKTVTLFRLLACVGGVLAALFFGLWLRARSDSGEPASPPLHTFHLESLPEGVTLFSHRGASIAVSPDGRHLVYAGVSDQGSLLFLRSLQEDYDPRPLPGTEGAFRPFFDPTSQWVGFFSKSPRRYELKKVAVEGSDPISLAGVTPGPCGGTWGTNDIIVLSEAYHLGLKQVDGSSGEGHTLTVPDVNEFEYGHLWPDLLPENRGVIFTVWDGDNIQGAKICIRWTDSGRQEDLISKASYARYVPTGHLVFARGGGLWAVRFDIEAASGNPLLGQEFMVLDDLGLNHLGAAQFDFSDEGTLVYAAPSGLTTADLVWVDTDGTPSIVPGGEGKQYYGLSAPRISPDGKQVVVRLLDSLKLSTLNLARQNFQLITSLPGATAEPVWGEREGSMGLYFTHEPAGAAPVMYWQSSDQSDLELFLADQYANVATSFASNPSRLAMASYSTDETADIRVMLEDKTSDWISQDAAVNEWSPIFSPDGNWIAFVSDKENRTEQIYLYDCSKRRAERITREGGSEPHWGKWSPEGGELFYRHQGWFWRLSIRLIPEMDWDAPEKMFDDIYLKGTLFPNYDVDVRDGRTRFLVVKRREETDESVTQIRFVKNWFELLRAKDPG